MKIKQLIFGLSILSLATVYSCNGPSEDCDGCFTQHDGYEEETVKQIEKAHPEDYQVTTKTKDSTVVNH